MSHFAKINDDNIVTEVIVVEQDVIDSGILGDPTKWIQTSYNTIGGIHAQGGIPLRKNFAGVGMIYDPARDAFYEPKLQGEFWVLNEDTCIWEFPIPYPQDDKMYYWSATQNIWLETDDPMEMMQVL